MEKRRNKKLSALSLAFLSVLIIGTVLIVRKQHNIPYIHNQGMVFGTVYSIKYQNDKDLQKEIEAELKKVDNSLSTFNKQSVISKINRNEDVNQINSISLPERSSMLHTQLIQLAISLYNAKFYYL